MYLLSIPEAIPMVLTKTVTAQCSFNGPAPPPQYPVDSGTLSQPTEQVEVLKPTTGNVLSPRNRHGPFASSLLLISGLFFNRLKRKKKKNFSAKHFENEKLLTAEKSPTH